MAGYTQRAIAKILLVYSAKLEESDHIHHQGVDKEAWPAINAAFIADIVGCTPEEVEEIRQTL